MVNQGNSITENHILKCRFPHFARLTTSSAQNDRDNQKNPVLKRTGFSIFNSNVYVYYFLLIKFP